MTSEAALFLTCMVALALGVGWLLGRNQSSKDHGEAYYSGYTDGYNTALDDIEEQVKAREARETKARKAKKVTVKKATTKKGKK